MKTFNDLCQEFSKENNLSFIKDNYRVIFAAKADEEYGFLPMMSAITFDPLIQNKERLPKHEQTDNTYLFYIEKKGFLLYDDSHKTYHFFENSSDFSRFEDADIQKQKEAFASLKKTFSDVETHIKNIKSRRNFYEKIKVKLDENGKNVLSFMLNHFGSFLLESNHPDHFHQIALLSYFSGEKENEFDIGKLFSTFLSKESYQKKLKESLQVSLCDNEYNFNPLLLSKIKAENRSKEKIFESINNFILSNILPKLTEEEKKEFNRLCQEKETLSEKRSDEKFNRLFDDSNIQEKISLLIDYINAIDIDEKHLHEVCLKAMNKNASSSSLVIKAITQANDKNTQKKLVELLDKIYESRPHDENLFLYDPKEIENCIQNKTDAFVDYFYEKINQPNLLEKISKNPIVKSLRSSLMQNKEGKLYHKALVLIFLTHYDPILFFKDNISAYQELLLFFIKNKQIKLFSRALSQIFNLNNQLEKSILAEMAIFDEAWKGEKKELILQMVQSLYKIENEALENFNSKLTTLYQSKKEKLSEKNKAFFSFLLKYTKNLFLPEPGDDLIFLSLFFKALEEENIRLPGCEPDTHSLQERWKNFSKHLRDFIINELNPLLNDQELGILWTLYAHNKQTNAKPVLFSMMLSHVYKKANIPEMQLKLSQNESVIDKIQNKSGFSLFSAALEESFLGLCKAIAYGQSDFFDGFNPNGEGSLFFKNINNALPQAENMLVSLLLAGKHSLNSFYLCEFGMEFFAHYSKLFIEEISGHGGLQDGEIEMLLEILAGLDLLSIDTPSSKTSTANNNIQFIHLANQFFREKLFSTERKELKEKILSNKKLPALNKLIKWYEDESAYHKYKSTIKAENFDNLRFDDLLQIEKESRTLIHCIRENVCTSEMLENKLNFIQQNELNSEHVFREIIKSISSNKQSTESKQAIVHLFMTMNSLDLFPMELGFLEKMFLIQNRYLFLDYLVTQEKTKAKHYPGISSQAFFNTLFAEVKTQEPSVNDLIGFSYVAEKIRNTPSEYFKNRNDLIGKTFSYLIDAQKLDLFEQFAKEVRFLDNNLTKANILSMLPILFWDESPQRKMTMIQMIIGSSGDQTEEILFTCFRDKLPTPSRNFNTNQREDISRLMTFLWENAQSPESIRRHKRILTEAINQLYLPIDYSSEQIDFLKMILSFYYEKNAALNVTQDVENQILFFIDPVRYQENLNRQAILYLEVNARRSAMNTSQPTSSSDALARIANNTESAMMSLLPEEEEALLKLKNEYEKKAKELDIDKIRQTIKTFYNQDCAKLKLDSGKTIDLPLEYEDFEKLTLSSQEKEKALKSYYKNQIHSGYRFFLEDNRWLFTEGGDRAVIGVSSRYDYAKKRNIRKTHFAEKNILSLIKLLWAALDNDSSLTKEDDLKYFITMGVASCERAHNWDQAREVHTKERGVISEYYDDMQADKPSCTSGIKSRLFRALPSHIIGSSLITKDLLEESFASEIYRFYVEKLKNLTDAERGILSREMNEYFVDFDEAHLEKLTLYNLSMQDQEKIQDEIFATLPEKHSQIKKLLEQTRASVFDATEHGNCHLIKFYLKISPLLATKNQNVAQAETTAVSDGEQPLSIDSVESPQSSLSVTTEQHSSMVAEDLPFFSTPAGNSSINEPAKNQNKQFMTMDLGKIPETTVQRENQAFSILSEAMNQTRKNQGKKVGMLVSLDAKQAEEINNAKTFAEAAKKINSWGSVSGQANMMQYIVKDIANTDYWGDDLKNDIRFIAIATIPVTVSKIFGANKIYKVDVERDLRLVQEFLEDGNTLIAFSTEKEGVKSFAIGGGASKNFSQTIESQTVQNTLKGYESIYGGLTQIDSARSSSSLGSKK